MRRLVIVAVLLAACDPSPRVDRAIAPARNEPAVPVTDLRFKDEELQTIAAALVAEARRRGIEEVAGRTRVERLISLEARLGASTLALTRANTLVAYVTQTDVSQWGQLRQQAQSDFAKADNETARRVLAMLEAWQRRKSETAYAYLSSNYETTYITSLQWERRFHDFVRERPLDAATWGWLVWLDYAAAIQKQYGRSDAETAYRYYVETAGLGDAREARQIFSVPGIRINDPRPPNPPRPRRRVGPPSVTSFR